MPEDVRHGGPQYNDPPPKKKRRPDPEPHYDPTPAPVSPTNIRNTADRLAYIEQRSNGVLPSEVTWALGKSQLDTKDIAKASRFFAKQFDLPVDDFLERVETQDMKGTPLLRYEDPINGGLLTLRSARRLLETAEPQIIASWLERQPKGARQLSIAPKNIIRVLNELTPLVGDKLNIGEALAISRDVVRGRNGKAFKANLEVLMDGSMKNDPKMALMVALDAAAEGKTFTDFTDVLGHLTGSDLKKETGTSGVTVDPKTGLVTPNQQDYITTEAGVGAVPVLTDLWEALKNKSASYSEEAERIMAELEARENDNSIGKRVVSGIFTGLEMVNRPLDAFVRVFGDPDAWTGPMLALLGEEGALEPTEVALQDAKEIILGDASVFDLQRMKDLGWSPGEIITWQLALSIGLPAGASAKAFAEAGTLGAQARAAALFAGEFVLDPLTAAGKVGRVAVGRKFLPFLNEADQGKAVTSFLTKGQVGLGGLTAPEFLVRSAIEGVDDASFFTKAVNKFRTTYATDGIHPLVSRSIFSFVKKGVEQGLDEDVLVKGVRDFFADALGLPSKNPLVKEIQDIAYNAQKSSLSRAKGLSELPSRVEALKVARRNAQAIEDQLGRAAAEVDNLGPLMHEVPHVRALNRTREALIPSLGDSKLGRVKKALALSELPLRSGSYFKFLPDQDLSVTIDGVDNVLTRSRVFSPTEMADYRQRLTNVSRPGFPARERMMGELLAEIQDDMLTRIGKEVGVEKDDLLRFVDETFGQGTGIKAKVLKKAGFNPDDAFAAYTIGGKEVTQKTPLVTSQLRNNFSLIDPVHVRKATKEAIGYGRELRAMAYRTIGKDAPITKGVFTKTPSRAIGVISRDVWRPIIGLVKFGWVARPAYVLRIVAGDELLRFLSTEGAAMRLRAGRIGSDVAARFEGIGAKGMLAAEGVLPTGPQLREAGFLSEDFASRFPGILPDEAQAGQGAIKFVANAEGDILPPDIQDAFVDHWQAVYHGQVSDDKYVSAWYRALFQFAQAEEGQRMLAARIRGLDEEAAIEDVTKWLREDEVGQSVVKRMKQVQGWDIDEAARTSVEYIWRLTPNADVARIAADGSMTAEALRTIDPSLWPSIVHGPAMNKGMNPAKFLGRVGQWWGRAILELPTNKLIRQPFFKANYTEVYDFLKDQARAAGRNVDEEVRGVARVARYNQVVEGDSRIARILDDIDEEAAAGGHGFFYHTTEVENLPGVAKEGLVPNEGAVFFADSPRNLTYAAPHADREHGRALIRFKDKLVQDAEGGEFPGEGFIERTLAPGGLEVLGDDGTWRPISSLDFGDAGLDKALQAEAKRFAIKRTQQIMFDFTRTGRIAEMAWFISPFLQPFTEFFVAWPRIIKQNPAMLGYANRLGVAAAQSGFFQDDPQTGEKVIPASNFALAAPLLAAITGGRLKNNLGGGWELSMSLSSFNMFTQSAFPVTVAGVEIPVPTPSFSPPAQWALQQFVDAAPIDDHLKTKMMAWLTEYGEVSATRPQDFALPTWLRHVLTGAVPSWFEDETNKNINRFKAMQQAMGLEPDDDAAHWQAQKYALMRGFFSSFFPAAPKINFPTSDLEAEWSATIEAADGDFNQAYEDFVGVWNPKTKKYEGGKHPGLTLITTSKTMWDDPTNPFPMPANKLAEQILNSDGGKQFAKDFPRWAFFIIPQEIRDGEADIGVLNAQVARGQRKVLTPTQFEESAESKAAWSAYFASKEQWTAWQNAHPDQESGDIGYDARQGEFETDVAAIAEEFPSWTGASEITLDRGVDPNIMREARTLLQSEEFVTKTDLGAGLKDYFDMRDQLELDMKAAGVSNLDTVVAEDKGFVKRYETGVKAIIEAHPDFGLAYQTFGFDNDLKNVRTAGEKALDAIPRETFNKVIDPWVDKWEKIRVSPYGGNIVLDSEKFERYAAIKDYANTAYQYPAAQNPLKLWWGKTDPNEKAEYLIGVGSRSPLYWSRFDWEVMGAKPTKQTTQFWTDVNNARTEAFVRNRTDPGFSLPSALDDIDRAVAIAAKKDPKIARQLEVINTWGYGLKTTVMGGAEGADAVATKNTKKVWGEVFEASAKIQQAADKYELTGTGDYDPDNVAYWNTIKDAFGAWIKRKQKDNSTFKRQWDYVQKTKGADRIINILMPDDYFPLGAADAGNAIDLGGSSAGDGANYKLNKKQLRTRAGVTMIDPALDQLVQAQKDLGVNILNHVVSSFRTREQQASMRAAYENGTGNLAAHPGHSMHEKGRAVDIDTSFLEQYPEVRRWLLSHGWVNEVGGEPWHFEMQGPA